MQRIVAAHEGSFGITSSAQEGTRAEVRLPLVVDTNRPEAKMQLDDG